jgi:type II secretory pathway pseudopilin PulG
VARTKTKLPRPVLLFLRQRLPMKSSGRLAISWRRYIEGIFALVEIVIIFLVIALLLATTVPGLLRARKRSQTSKIVTLTQS